MSDLHAASHSGPEPDSFSKFFKTEHNYLTFKDIEAQYQGTVKAGTLYVWDSTRRHNFHRIVTRIGTKVLVRRDRWEAFLAACRA